MGSADYLPVVLLPVAVAIIYFAYLLIRQMPEPSQKPAPTPATEERREPGVRQLDLVIIAVILFMIGAPLLYYGGNYIAAHSGQLTTPGVNMEQIFGAIVFFGFWGGLAYYVYKYFQDKKALAEAKEQPFKVNVAIVPSEYKNPGADFIRGRRLTHFLHIDVHIGLKDWKRIKDAGVYDAVLFSFPNNRSTFDGTKDTCHVRELKQPFSIGFYNLIDAEEVKETLLAKLYDLKDTIAVQEEGRREESFEI